MRPQPQLEQRSLEQHRMLAEKIRSDPALLDRARTILQGWQDTAILRAIPYLDDWQKLLDQGLDACLAVAIEESERGCALRKTSPLPLLLTKEECSAFVRKWGKAPVSAFTQE